MLSIPQVGRRMGVSRRSAETWLARRGVPIKQPGGARTKRYVLVDDLKLVAADEYEAVTAAEQLEHEIKKARTG